MAAKHKNTHKVLNDEPVVLRKRWPTRTEIHAWWIYYKIQTSPVCEIEDPEKIKEWLLELHQLTDMGAHVELFAYCKEFRIEFKSPRDQSYGSGVGIGRVSG
jgi:hypothetical protein